MFDKHRLTTAIDNQEILRFLLWGYCAATSNDAGYQTQVCQTISVYNHIHFLNAICPGNSSDWIIDQRNNPHQE